MTRCNLLYILIISVAAIGGCKQAVSQEAPPQKPPPPEVFYTVPVVKRVTDFEDFIGHTESPKMVQIRSRVKGYLDKVNFDDGAVVKKDDVLFLIDPRPYQDDLDNKNAVVAQGQRHVERLKSDYDRATKEIASKVISQEQYDQYRFDYIEAQATLLASIASQEVSKLNLDWTKVTAPIAGRVSRRMVDPGNMVINDDTMLTTIVAEDPLYAYFDVDERTLLRLRRLVDEGKIKSLHNGGAPVMLALSDETTFVDDKGAARHEGTIDFVDNQVDPQTGTIRFRGDFANPKGLLSPGLFVRIRLPVGQPHDAVLIAESALTTDQGRKFLYVVDAENKATYRPVEVGSTEADGLIVITKGLAAGEKVVVSGLQRIRPGVEVNAKPQVEEKK